MPGRAKWPRHHERATERQNQMARTEQGFQVVLEAKDLVLDQIPESPDYKDQESNQ